MAKSVHLGVTGLRRTGKTVFLTALIYQLTQRGSKGLDAFSGTGYDLMPGRLLPPARELAPFPYDDNIRALRESPARFPPSTVSESGGLLEIPCFTPRGKMSWLRFWDRGKTQLRLLRLHFHDYPGEFLLDAPMIELTYSAWSTEALDRMRRQCGDVALERGDCQLTGVEAAREEFEKAASLTAGMSVSEGLNTLRTAYGRYVWEARRRGLEFLPPGAALLPWLQRHEGCADPPPAPTETELPFVPLCLLPGNNQSLIVEMWNRYEDYKRSQVKPFIKRIRRCDRHLVLVDVLRVLRNGCAAHNDFQECLSKIIRMYYRRWFNSIRRVLFAATKADHATNDNRPNLALLLDEMVSKAKGQTTTNKVMSSHWFTSIRSTRDAIGEKDEREIQLLRGVKNGAAEATSTYPGSVPPSIPNGRNWTFDNLTYKFPEFVPSPLPRANGVALEHMNLDEIIWNLLW